MPRFLRSDTTTISDDLSKLSLVSENRVNARAKRRVRREKIRASLDKENVDVTKVKATSEREENVEKEKKQRKPKRKSSIDESEEEETEMKAEYDSVPKRRRPTRITLEDEKVTSKWPIGMLRYDYRIFSRSCFHSLGLLTKGGVGVVFAAKALCNSSKNIKTPVKNGGGGYATPKMKRTSMEIVLKIVQDPTDWNDELTGFWNSRSNPYVVSVIGIVLLSGGECNELCQEIEGYKQRLEAELIPTMVFEKWDGSMEDAMDRGTLAGWGLFIVVDLLIDVAMAVSLLHKSGNMHRDIKCANILYRLKSKRLTAALCDLGLATTLGPTTRRGKERVLHTQGVGTDGFMAPECRDGTNYSTPADIFSLAVACEKIVAEVKTKPEEVVLLFKSLTRQGQSLAPEKRQTADEFLAELRLIKERLATVMEKETKSKTGKKSSGSKGTRRRLPLNDIR